MLAVNVVLIPPYSIREQSIQLNEALASNGDLDFLLDHQTCVPHISLIMGAVCEKKLEVLQQKLQFLAEEIKSIELNISAYAVSVLPNQKYVSSLIIDKNQQLQKLHELLCKKLRSLLKHDEIDKEMFCEGMPIPELSVSWVRRFMLDSSKENYLPHITLGLGQIKDVTLPISFKASEMALYQLGNYCTCRKKLWSKKLST